MWGTSLEAEETHGGGAADNGRKIRRVTENGKFKTQPADNNYCIECGRIEATRVAFDGGGARRPEIERNGKVQSLEILASICDQLTPEGLEKLNGYGNEMLAAMVIKAQRDGVEEAVAEIEKAAKPSQDPDPPGPDRRTAAA